MLHLSFSVAIRLRWVSKHMLNMFYVRENHDMQHTLQ